MLKNKFYPSVILVFTVLLITPALYAGIIIDGLKTGYPALIETVNAVSPGLPVDAVMLSSPFKLYEKNFKGDDCVYDFTDLGDTFQRGSLETALGNKESLLNFASSLKDKKIQLFMKVNLFNQKIGYKTSFWDKSDFLPASGADDTSYLVDIERQETKAKLEKIAVYLKTLPVDKWVIDCRSLPDSLREKYENFAKNILGNFIILITDTDKVTQDITISAHTYWDIRRDVFILPSPSFQKLKGLTVPPLPIHYVESDVPSWNNLAATAYLLIQSKKVMVPVRLLNSFAVSLLSHALKLADPTMNVLSDNRLIFYSKKGLIAFNFSDTLTTWKIENKTGFTGIKKSMLGSALLRADNKSVSLFVYPQSIAFWDFGF